MKFEWKYFHEFTHYCFAFEQRFWLFGSENQFSHRDSHIMEFFTKFIRSHTQFMDRIDNIIAEV